MAKNEKRSANDFANFNVRMKESVRAKIEAAAHANGRSMNAEILHRIEDYARLSDTYSIATSDPEVKGFASIIAAAVKHYDDTTAHQTDGAPRLETLVHDDEGKRWVHVRELTKEEDRLEGIIYIATTLINRQSLTGIPYGFASNLQRAIPSMRASRALQDLAKSISERAEFDAAGHHLVRLRSERDRLPEDSELRADCEKQITEILDRFPHLADDTEESNE